MITQVTGREFEDFCVKRLHEAGYWVHRIHPDESGQQPFDLIAIRGSHVCAYDAKVLSEGKRFPLSRIEDNQFNAFRLVEKKCAGADIGLLVLGEDKKIRHLDISRIKTALCLKKKSVELAELPEWRP